MSPTAVPIFAHNYDRNTLAGEVVFGEDEKGHWTSIVVGGQTLMRVAVRREDETVLLDGIDRYIGHDGAGDLVSVDVSYWGPSKHSRVVEFEVAENAPKAMRAMRPVSQLFSQSLFDFRCIWSVPNQVRSSDSDAVAEKRALLSILAATPQAAMLVLVDGTVVHMNPAARDLAGGSITRSGGKLRAGLADQHRLDELLKSVAGEGQAAGDPFRLELPLGPAVLAQAFSIDSVGSEQKAVLVFLTDPARPTDRDPRSALELLGLTKAEARIAAAVGIGMPTRKAGEQLGLAESTVRSTLKQVYSKLGISRQSELAGIVTRLSSMAVEPARNS